MVGDHPGSQELFGDHPGGVELAWKPSRRSRSGWEILLKVQKWSADPAGGPEVVR